MLNRKAVSSAFEALAPSAAPAPLFEELEGRQLMSTAQAIGININNASGTAVNASAAKLHALGVTTVRVWAGISSFNSRSPVDGFKQAEAWHDAGFNVDLEVSPNNGTVPSASAIQSFFQWAVSDDRLRSSVSEWEIGNEPDSSKYWKGSLGQYVNNYLTPAYDALHAAGETVISAGPSWNPQDVQTMINAGLLNVCDYVGFHPYAKGVSGVEKTVAEIDAVVAGRKPIAATEWSVRGISDRQDWADAVQEVYPAIKQGFALNYYFCQQTMNSMAGPGGIFKTDWSANTPFYNAFASFQDNDDALNSGYGGASNSGGSTGGGTTTGGGTGNTPSGIGSISGTLFEDTNDDGKYDGSEVGTGIRTVFIDSNGNGRLDSGEKTTTSDSNGKYTFNGLGKGTYKISRVFPPGYKLSNNDSGDVSITIATGQKVNGVNLGTVSTGSTNTNTGTSSSAAPKVTNIALINAATGSTIGTYTKNATVKLSSMPKTGVAIAANVSGDVDSVKMTGLGRTSVENNAPYTVLNDTSSGGYGAWVASKGSQTFSATAYSGDNATGTKGSTVSVTLTFA